MSEEVIYVGTKPVMNYVTAATMKLNEASEVALKARGRAISTAVDCAEIVRNKFMPDAEIVSIETDTEAVSDSEGGERNVSTITIELKR